MSYTPKPPFNYLQRKGWREPANRLPADPKPMGSFMGMPIPSTNTFGNAILNWTGQALLPVGDPTKMQHQAYVAPDRALRIKGPYAALRGSAAPVTDLSQSLLAHLGNPEMAQRLRALSADPSVATGLDPRLVEVMSRI